MRNLAGGNTTTTKQSMMLLIAGCTKFITGNIE